MAVKRKPRPDLAERNRARATHGMSDTRAHNQWRSMIRRCEEPGHKDYPRYGGRGITVCERWKDFSSFLADMGQPEAGMTLDRRENDLGYSPDNCRWATATEQSRNRRSNVLVSYDGQTLTVAEWAERTGIERKTLEYRIRAGWEAQRALTTPSLINRKAA